MDQDGHPPELLLSLIYAGVRVHLEDLEWVEIPIGVARLGKSLYLSGWCEVLVSLLYLKYFLSQNIKSFKLSLSPLSVPDKMNQKLRLQPSLSGNLMPF